MKPVPNREIAILVSSLRRVTELGIPFVFTNQHAYLAAAEYFNDLNDLDRVDSTGRCCRAAISNTIQTTPPRPTVIKQKRSFGATCPLMLYWECAAIAGQ